MDSPTKQLLIGLSFLISGIGLWIVFIIPFWRGPAGIEKKIEQDRVLAAGTGGAFGATVRRRSIGTARSYLSVVLMFFAFGALFTIRALNAMTYLDVPERLEGPLDDGLALIALCCLICVATTKWFARPKFLIPPHLRDQGGQFSDWWRDRQAKRAARQGQPK